MTSPTEPGIEGLLPIFKTTISGIGPFCVEFPDGEIVTCRTEERAKHIASWNNRSAASPNDLLLLAVEALKRNRAALDLIDPMRPLQYATTMGLMRKDMDATLSRIKERL